MPAVSAGDQLMRRLPPTSGVTWFYRKQGRKLNRCQASALNGN
ncbi:hypothetical protein [Alishewanella longhuensis]